MFKPRPKQQEVLDYTGGMMGVAAVPGSGKTRTLSYLAAKLVSTAPLDDEQEVLVVTLVNSAVDNFNQRVNEFIRGEFDLLPGFGYRVRTLHSLANDIVREHPALVGLSDDFTIVDERESGEILQDAVDAWVRGNPQAADEFLGPNYIENQRVRYQHWPNTAREVANNFIRQSKDMQLTPEQVRIRLDNMDTPLSLTEMCWRIYADYQRGLAYRGAVDFQDLIRLALKTLELDENYLKRLNHQWPYILEDEAQDSSKLQQDILRLLVGKNGNWVRVGDPNQAIYETFTTANPKYLWEFLDEKGVQKRELPNSGRSTQSIINMANYLIEWTKRHPVQAICDRKPLQEPFIAPTPKGDPQPNPPDNPQMVHVRAEDYVPQAEVRTIVKSLARWLPEHPDQTAAVLVPRNQRGFEVVRALKEAKIEYVEMLRSTSSTREVAGAIGNILNYLADPLSPNRMATVFRVWRRDSREDPEEAKAVNEISTILKKCKQVEDFIWPGTYDWLDAVAPVEGNPELHEYLLNFRGLIRRWQEAAMLPIDQLILTVAGDLFQNAVDLAVAYSMALYLRRFGEMHPDSHLPQFTEELARVAKNERRYLGLSDDDMGFDPDRYKGKVTVATMHSAKGLEWDRVYLMSVNNYDFPSAQVYDSYISEKWFVRDKLNLAAEALAQLESLVDERSYVEGKASNAARIDYAAERLRLLYVGITRARRELVMTWNTGRRGDQLEALPMIALQTFWEEQNQ